MSVIGSIEAAHELCADLDNLIERTKESRAALRRSRRARPPESMACTCAIPMA